MMQKNQKNHKKNAVCASQSSLGVGMEKIASLAKRRGFIFPGSEIYGGLRGTWDYGPLGSELKFNLKQSWWDYMVSRRENIFGIQSAILMSSKVWEASGHTQAFTDPLVECKICHERLRADQVALVDEHSAAHQAKGEKPDWTEPKQFNLLVEAKLGVVENAKDTVYLRGEITQGVHVNFKNILDSMRPKLPFGVAQIGKAFRNEITPGNLTYRSREFEQMELQWYARPEEAGQWFSYWKEERMKWYLSLGMNKKKLRFRQHPENERSHYAKDAWDIEYETPWGWRELEGIHLRGDWDLSQHAKFSKEDMRYFDAESGEKFFPYIIETSGGVDRALLFFLTDAYAEEQERTVLKLHPRLAPYKAAIFPLLANKPQLVEKAREVFRNLKSDLRYPIAWDDRGNIGKRYYSQDEIGTPFCITVDFDTLENPSAGGDVTVRDRDTAKQERVPISELKSYLEGKLQ